MYRWLSVLTLAAALQAAVKLPALISDHMVLQEGMPVRIWGTADPVEDTLWSAPIGRPARVFAIVDTSLR